MMESCQSSWHGAESSIYLVTDRTRDVEWAAEHLARIGIDQIDGALAGGFGT